MFLRRMAGILLLLAAGTTSTQAEIRIGIAAPLTGHFAWAGEETRAGAEAAIQHFNDSGGVLGEMLAPILVDDFCDPEQAVAAARKLVVDRVQFVIGHQCSGAAIPASEIYEEAGIIFVSPKATNPRLTARGLQYTFRTCGRDDLQGTIIGDRIAKTWPRGKIAIVHDGQTYGEGVAKEVRRRLDERGIMPIVLGQVAPGQMDFSSLAHSIETLAISVLFYGGYPAEAGLIVRQTKMRVPELAVIVPDGVAHEDFWLIAGDAAEGTEMTQLTDPTHDPAAARVVADLVARGIEPIGGVVYAYAAVEAWAQAVKAARTTAAVPVAEVLRSKQLSTVLGQIRFDANGDVSGFEPFTWYVWTDGNFVPKKP
jgi:branched-chain amino acid transport system substrate-binding protein